jgi:hypothetical protein
MEVRAAILHALVKRRARRHVIQENVNKPTLTGICNQTTIETGTLCGAIFC